MIVFKQGACNGKIKDSNFAKRKAKLTFYKTSAEEKSWFFFFFFFGGGGGGGRCDGRGGGGGVKPERQQNRSVDVSHTFLSSGKNENVPSL